MAWQWLVTGLLGAGWMRERKSDGIRIENSEIRNQNVEFLENFYRFCVPFAE